MGVLICNLSAGIMIILTLIMRRFAKNKIPNGVFCLLWFMIGIRLLFPASFRTKLSILNIYFHFRNKPVPIGYRKEEVFHVDVIEQVEAIAVLAEGYEYALFAVWLVGFCLGAIYFITGYFQVWKKMEKAKPLENIGWLENCISERKIGRKIRLKSIDEEDSPKTWGIFRPVIYFPSDFDLENKELSLMVLLHECGHIKYFHSLFKIWNMVLLCLYWYNPAVWIMFRKFERDLEISADRYALGHTEGDARKQYARYVIAIAEKIKEKYEKKEKREIKYYRWFSHLCKKDSNELERVEAIMNFKKLGTSAIIATLLIPMGMTSVFATTNVVLPSERTSFAINDEITVINEIGNIAEEGSLDSIFVEWDELKQYVHNDKTRASSYLIVENYKYETYGRIPPQGLVVSTTVDGHKYSGTLTLTEYNYNVSLDKYTGYYSGKIYLQD